MALPEGTSETNENGWGRGGGNEKRGHSIGTSCAVDEGEEDDKDEVVGGDSGEMESQGFEMKSVGMDVTGRFEDKISELHRKYQKR